MRSAEEYKDSVIATLLRANADIQTEKERLFIEALERYRGILINKKREAERRFSRFSREIHKNADQSSTEIWYFNDQTKDGLKVIEFYTKSPFSKDVDIGFTYRVFV